MLFFLQPKMYDFGLYFYPPSTTLISQRMSQTQSPFLQSSSIQTKPCQTAVQALCVLLASVLSHMGEQAPKTSNLPDAARRVLYGREGLQYHISEILQSHQTSFLFPLDILIPTVYGYNAIHDEANIWCS